MVFRKLFGRWKKPPTPSPSSPPPSTKQPNVVNPADVQDTKNLTIDQTITDDAIKRSDAIKQPEAIERSQAPQVQVSPKLENVPIQQLWTVAYETLREEDGELIEEYEAKLQESVIADSSDNHRLETDIKEQMRTILEIKMADVNKNTTKLKLGSSEVAVKDIAQLLLNVVNSANSFISQAVSASPPASIAWAGVSFLLPLFMNISTQSIAQAKGLEYVSSLIAQSQVREELYIKRYGLRTENHEGFQQSHHEYKAALERLYRQILNFQAKSCCYYSNTSYRRHTGDAFNWNGWDQLLNDIREREQSFLAVERLWRDMQHLEERRETENAESRKECEELLKWLCDNDHSSLYNTARERHQDGTNEWLVKHSEEFKAWKTTARSLLWLHGKAGSGKSVLSSSVISYLKEQYTSKHSTAIAYFYYSFSDIKTQTTDAMLASLIKQICSRQLDIQLIKHLQDYKIKGERPDTKTLEQTLLASMLKLSAVYIVIDGLDECPLLGGRRETLLRTLTNTFSKAPENLHVFLTSRKEHDIDLKIRALLSLPASCEIDLLARQEAVNRDICQYINTTLATDSFTHWRDNVKEEVQQSLIRKADSMFQYVRFQLKALQELSSPADIRQALLDLPVGLNATYDRILENISTKFQNQVINSLKWLAFAKRVLTIKELSEIFIISSDDNNAFDEDKRPFSSDDVLKYFSGLVITSKAYGGTQVRLVHFCVKEYLTSDRIEQRPASAFSFTEINAHEHIVRSCLAYLTHVGTMVGKWTEIEQWRVKWSYPLFEYVEKNWAPHLEEISRALWSAELSHEVILALAVRSQSLHALTLLDKKFRYFDTPDIYMLNKPYCYTAQRGFLQLTEALLSQEFGVRGYLTQEDLDFGLQYAAYGGNSDIVRLFLQAGATVNMYYGKHKWHSALHAALSGSRSNVLELLIKHGGADSSSYSHLLPWVRQDDWQSFEFLLDLGVDIDAQDDNQQTVLHFAMDGSLEVPGVPGVTEMIISLLLAKGASINVLSDKFGTPLHAACTSHVFRPSSSLTNVKTLLAHGADPNIRGGEYATALQALCYTGLRYERDMPSVIESIVLLLIKHGADVSAQGGEYGTALHAAAAASQYSEHAIPVMQLLLDHGAQVDQPGGDNWGTALQLACNQGTLEAVQFLLDHGADVNAEGGSRFGTPLQAAAGRETAKRRIAAGEMERSGDAIPPQNKVQLLELLLDRGAKINQQGGEWGSALQAACQDPDVRVLRLLLKRGADANASGGMNGSALMIACGVHRDYKVNSRKCIQLLLDRGADVNAQSEEHGTALMAACGVYFKDVERVQLLLKHGANVNAQGGKYGTALMAACAVYSKDVKRLQLLLNHTAVVNAEIRRYEKLLMALEATGRENEDNRETSVEVLPPDSDYFLSPDSVPVARLLLRHKADVNAQGANYGTALSAACSWGHSELIQLLLEHGADIHLQDCTAWHKAAHYAALYLNGDKALLSLLSHGMHVNHVHKEYGTALHSIMGEFAPGGIEKSAQFWPSLHQRIAIHEHRFLTEDEHWRRSFDVLIKHGMDTSIVSERLGSALHVACAMKLDETHRKANHSGSCCPSIHCTSRKTKYLLERVPGMDVNVQGGIFGSALQAAAYSGQALSVKMLLERKASVDVRGGKYRSALNGAIVGGHWDIVEILLEAGATPDCDLQEQPDEEWLQTLLKEDGRGAVERYQKFWDMRKEKKSKGI